MKKIIYLLLAISVSSYASDPSLMEPNLGDEREGESARVMTDESDAFYFVVDKKLEAGSIVNAVSHLSIALGSILSKDAMKQTPYLTSEGVKVEGISECPSIILKGKQTHVSRLYQDLEKAEFPVTYVPFFDTMQAGPNAREQIKLTLEKNIGDLTILALGFFGKRSQLKHFTKKFSIYS